MSTFSSWHFFWSCLVVSIMSIAPLLFLNAHWLSGRNPDCSRCSFNRLIRTLARLFLAVDYKEVLGCFSQAWGFPFRLNRWIINASMNSWVTASFLHIMWSNCQFLCNWSTSSFVDLCKYCIWFRSHADDESFIAFTVSETVGSSSSSGFHLR